MSYPSDQTPSNNLRLNSDSEVKGWGRLAVPETAEQSEPLRGFLDSPRREFDRSAFRDDVADDDSDNESFSDEEDLDEIRREIEEAFPNAPPVDENQVYYRPAAYPQVNLWDDDLDINDYDAMEEALNRLERIEIPIVEVSQGRNRLVVEWAYLPANHPVVVNDPYLGVMTAAEPRANRRKSAQKSDKDN